MGDIKIDGRSITDLQNSSSLEHQEYRDDRYVAAIDVGWEKKRLLFTLLEQ